MSKYRDNRRPGVLYTRNFLLRSICGIYLMAFVSFYYQSEGLYGNNGIVPAVTQFKASPTSPNLLRFAGSLNLDLSTAVDLLALLGAIVSFAGFVSRYMISMPLFAILWLLYYSLTDIMGPFVSQADNLLLEAGIICVFMAPANPRKQNPNDRLGLLMMRWLLFRFLFTSGAVKLASQCPHWWRLDGLERHLETMPLPTQLTWYSFNYIPKHLLQLTMAYVNVSELLVSFLFLAPPFAFRKFAFYWHLFLQFHIIATGNYGYLNFLVVVLLFALLNDSTFSKKKESQLGDWLLMLVTLVGVGYAMWYLFGIKMDNGVFSFKLNFNQERYNDALSTAVKVAPCMCLIGILGTFLNEVVSNESIRNQKSTIKKIFICLKTSLFMLICLTLLSLSVVPLRRILPETRVDNTDLGNLYEQATPYRMVNEYGKHLVKMRSERLEIVMEHSESAEGPWTEYPFAYKPGPEKSNLSMAGPYFPRLDFQLWEAAPSNIGKHLWVSSLTFRLLQNDPAVLRLLGVTVPPRKKPTYVRAMLYKLKYSSLPGKDGQWKRRALAEFLPAQSLDSELLATHLKSLRIPKKNPKPVVKNALVKSVLDKTRTTVSMLEGSFLTIAILATGFALIATKRT